MTLFIFGIILGWITCLVYVNQQDDDEEMNNGALVVIIMLIIVWTALGIGTGDFRSAADSINSMSQTPTPVLGR